MMHGPADIKSQMQTAHTPGPAALIQNEGRVTQPCQTASSLHHTCRWASEHIGQTHCQKETKSHEIVSSLLFPCEK